MIAACELDFCYPGAASGTLHQLSFTLATGSLCCLLGVNGSGKSSLLQVLAGMYAPTGGTLDVGEGAIALLPQDPDVYILGSLVREDLFLALEPENTEGRAHALELATRFGLNPMLDEPVHVLSHGQKRQLCLASALASRPALLLLDEPFAGLDYPASLVLRHTLAANKAAGLTQIITTHDLDLVADLADSFLVLHKGTLLAQGEDKRVFPLLAQAGVRPPCWWFSDGDGPLWEQ